MAAISNYTVIGTDDDFTAVYQPTTSTVYALNFWAAWAPPCEQMNDVFEELASKNSNIKFIKVTLQTQFKKKGERENLTCFDRLNVVFFLNLNSNLNLNVNLTNLVFES
jgi:thiol-disulfide isomerase/thioredoxin